MQEDQKPTMPTGEVENKKKGHQAPAQGQSDQTSIFSGTAS